MKVKTTERFRDRETGCMVAPGTVMDVEEQRGRDMVSASLAVPLEKPRKPKADKAEE